MTKTGKRFNRITVGVDFRGGTPIPRDMGIAVEHVPGRLAAGDSTGTRLSVSQFLEAEDIQAFPDCANRSPAGGHAHGHICVRGDL